MREQQVTIYRAGTVFSLGAADVEAFGVANGRFVATGAFQELLERYPSAEVIDLNGKTVIPGFHDAHAHFADSVQGRLDLNVAPEYAPDVEALIARIGQRITERGAANQGWVLASNYDDSLTGLVHRDRLDAAFPDIPVLVRQVSAHWAVLNTAALRALDVQENEPDISGGSYGRDENGRLDGRVFERALLGRYVTRPGDPLRPIPLGDPAEIASIYEDVAAEWSSWGVTSTCDAFVGSQQLAAHMAGRKGGQRKIRVGMLLAVECYNDFESLGFGTGFGDEWLRIVGVKAFVDGAIGGRTCLVSEPFCGTHDHGMAISSKEELDALVMKVHGDGNRLGIHANGDAAIRMLLDAYEAAAAAKPTGVRHRIEHCSIVDDEIIARIAALNLMVTPFSRYASFYGGRLESWYGEERTQRMFAHRSFLDAGVTVGASTDYPASPLSPFAAIQSMVTRVGDDGASVGQSQAITIEEALGVYTVGSATATGEEDIKGRIEPGYLADFLVLDRDPRAVDPHELSTVSVLRTYVDGELVFEAK